MSGLILTRMVYEPIFCNRYIVEFPENLKIPAYGVKNVTMPKYENGKWGDFVIEFMEITSPLTSKGLMNLINYVKENKKSYFNIKFLDNKNDEKFKWTVAFNDDIYVDFGGIIDYSNGEIITLKLIVKPTYLFIN